MGVATHLGIDLREYDTRIRTFIPDYEEMLDVAAAAVPSSAVTIVDLGTGTGALAARCAAKAKRARVVAIDVDGEIMKAAALRLGGRGKLVCGNFVRVPLPECDAVVASFALHHIRTRAAKLAFYRRILEALRPGGLCVTVDCHPAHDVTVAHEQMVGWKRHLQQVYSAAAANSYLRAWSDEDVYVPLQTEIRMIERSGLAVEVLWRKGAFAVLRASKTGIRVR